MQHVTLVANGLSSALINVSSLADGRIKAAAGLLAEYVFKATGAVMPILTGDEMPEERAKYDVWITVGEESPLTGELRHSLKEMDDEGFMIHALDKQVIITGRSSWGTTHGVCEFLERYVGVRWLMPGEDGEDVPFCGTLTIPCETVVQQPAFMSRTFSPLKIPDNMNGPLHYEWAVRNRLPYRFHSHHNMFVLFPPDKYGHAHPEFYPMRGGKRYVPPAQINYEWQPDFSNPATVRLAIDSIVNYFDENPQQTCYSLGINDSSGYCEEDPGHPNYRSRLNSKGFVDMSDTYYSWVNQVAEGVLKVHPDKWFGLLAYENVIDPPSFPLNPRVIPVITKDRMSWIDPEVAAADRELLQDWERTASSTGWYDYIYGNPYMVPRMYLHQAADNYRYALEHGVAVQYAELYPNWGEGPKPWVTAKLLWDPHADVDALLGEWCERAVGHEAAPYLAAYYEHWEKFWTVRIRDSAWFRKGKELIYLLFNDPQYLDLISDEEMSACRKLLERTVEHAATDKQKRRAQLLLDAFGYYEASVLSYPRTAQPVTDARTALSMLQDGSIVKRVERAQERVKIAEKLQIDPILKHPIDIYGCLAYGLRIWSGWNSSQFWRLADYLREREQAGGPVRERVKELAEDEASGNMQEYAQLLRNAASGSSPLLAFDAERQVEASAAENGAADAGTVLAGAALTLGRGLTVSADEALTLGRGRTVSADEAVTLGKGLFAGRVACYAPEGTTKGTVELLLRGLDSQGEAVFELRSAVLSLAAAAGGWSSLDILEDASQSADLASVTQMQVVVKTGNFAPGQSIKLGRLEVY